MASRKFKWCLAAAALMAAALAGCHDNGSSSSPSPPTAAYPPVVWSTFVKQVFSNDANTMPVNLDGLTFDFDVDNDPTAFDALLM